MATHVLIAGVSTRAIAESAARAGFNVTALDAFADLDQHPAVRALSIPRDAAGAGEARALALAGRDLECDAVSYVSNFENDPRAVEMLASGRALWGNSPSTLAHVRDPRLVAAALARAGDKAPVVHVPTQSASLDSLDGHWLVKPVASGGGRHVRVWSRGTRVPHGCYLQEFIEGTPGSVVFVAAGGCAVPLGLSRQLTGERAFGATRYQYCGNILTSPDEILVERVSSLARTIAREFDVIGVNGVDFVERDGVPYAIEVNPRWSASMELVEQAYGVSMFGVHAAACAEGRLPEFDLSHARRGVGAFGKAVVFARHAIEIGETREWLADSRVRDVPHTHEKIPAGGPICTVYAAGRDAAECHAALVRRAEEIYADVSDGL